MLSRETSPSQGEREEEIWDEREGEKENEIGVEREKNISRVLAYWISRECRPMEVGTSEDSGKFIARGI